MEHEFQHQDANLFHFQPKKKLLIAGKFPEYDNSPPISIHDFEKEFHSNPLVFHHP